MKKNNKLKSSLIAIALCLSVYSNLLALPVGEVTCELQRMGNLCSVFCSDHTYYNMSCDSDLFRNN